MVHIIGEIATAEKNMEQFRAMMRLAKKPEEKAEYKREFRKARNRMVALKQEINGGAE